MGRNRLDDFFFMRCRAHYPKLTVAETAALESRLTTLANARYKQEKRRRRLTRAAIATVRRSRFRLIEGGLRP